MKSTLLTKANEKLDAAKKVCLRYFLTKLNFKQDQEKQGEKILKQQASEKELLSRISTSRNDSEELIKENRQLKEALMVDFTRKLSLTYPPKSCKTQVSDMEERVKISENRLQSVENKDGKIS